MSDKDASEFWWASVLGAKCETVQVTTLNGERVAITCGCPDPFYLDRPNCPLVLVGEEPLDRPLPPAEQKKEDRRQKAREAFASKMYGHSWTGEK